MDCLVLRAAGELGIISAVDQQPRQGRAVELDRPAAAAAGDEDVGDDRVDPLAAARSGSRAWDRRRAARGSCRPDPRRRRRRSASARRDCPWRDSRDCRSAAPSPDRSGRPPSPGARGIRRGCARRRRPDRRSGSTASTRSTSCERRRRAAGRCRAASASEIAGLVDLLDDLVGDEQVGAATALSPAWRDQMIVRARARRPRSCRNRGRPRRRRRRRSRRGRGRRRARRIESAALSWWKFSLSKSMSSGASPRRRRSARRRSGSSARPSSLAGSSRLGARRLVLVAAAGASSSGFFSISSAMKLSTSRLDSASSRIACWSCGVITSDWVWRRSRRGPERHRSASTLTARSSRRDRGGGHSRRRPAPPGCRRTAPGRHR